MNENKKKNLLIIYHDSVKRKDTYNLCGLFDIITIPKVKRITFSDFSQNGNHLVSGYNDILYNTETENVFFICSSEINHSTLNILLNYDLCDRDFDFFLDKKANKLTVYLSGLVVKRETLVRIGFFDKYIFYNLYFNFLINYSRFFDAVTANEKFQVKMGILDFMKYSYWSYFEQAFYLSQPLYKPDYMILCEKMDTVKGKHFMRKIIAAFMKWYMRKKSSRTEEIIQSTTYIAYW